MKLFSIYIVGDCGPEHDSAYKYFWCKRNALKEFEELRLRLLNHAYAGGTYCQNRAKKELKKLSKNHESYQYYKNIAKNGDEMYNRMIKSLSETDPEKIDNYPHETPYIRKVYVEF